jgi:homogentisate 1,2-dioxygenase
LDKINIAQHAAHLTEPFTMTDLAAIDDLALSVFLCQGTLPSHRHLDQDELFWVYSGTISLESDWGTVILRPGELSMVPKGLGHRSSSLLRSLVLLFQPRLMVNRRNGDRLLFAPKDEGHLDKISLQAMGRHIAVPFRPVLLTHVDIYALQLMSCQGDGPWWQTDRQDSLVLCCEGALVLETATGRLPLEGGELAVVPKGVAYRLTSADAALVVGVQRHRQPNLPLTPVGPTKELL